MCTQSQP